MILNVCFIYCSWYILQHPHIPAEKVWFDYWDCCLTEPISLSDIEFISINTLPSKPRSPILHIKEPSPLPFLLNWYGTVWALWSMAAKGYTAWKSVTLHNNTEIKNIYLIVSKHTKILLEIWSPIYEDTTRIMIKMINNKWFIRNELTW